LNNQGAKTRRFATEAQRHRDWEGEFEDEKEYEDDLKHHAILNWQTNL
jgi:hypothetical protein